MDCLLWNQSDYYKLPTLLHDNNEQDDGATEDQDEFDLWIADILSFDPDACREILSTINGDEAARQRLFRRIDEGCHENRMHLLRLAAKCDPLLASIEAGMRPSTAVDVRSALVASE